MYLPLQDKKSSNEGAGTDEVNSLTEKFITEKDSAAAVGINNQYK